MSWTGRQRNFIDFTISSLLRRKWKNAALISVYTLVVFMLSSVMFFAHSIKKEASIILRGAPEITVQRMVAGRHDLIPYDYLKKIKSIPGVGAVRGRLWGYYYDRIFGANYTLLVPEDFKYGAGNIAVGKGVSRVSLSDEDNILPFRTHEGRLVSFTIKDILSPESELVSSDLILMSEGDFRSLFGMPRGRFTDLTLSLRDPAEAPVIAAEIKKILPDTRPVTRDEILRTYDAVFDWRGGIMPAILSGAVAAFLILAWDKATGLSAEEKREIGILKAVGWETSDVIMTKFWEGIVISLTSFMAGLLLAYAHIFFASASIFGPVLKGWAVLYPEFRPVPFIDGYRIATLFFLTVVPYTVATIVPSWRAAATNPDTVMR